MQSNLGQLKINKTKVMSRKISQLAASVFVRGGQGKTTKGMLQSNTMVVLGYMPDKTPTAGLYLHRNMIARNEGGKISITTAGWNTVTTRERLNTLPGVRLYVHKGILYLNDKQWNGEWIVI